MRIRRNGVSRRQGHVQNEVDHVFMVMEGRPCRRSDCCGECLCGGRNAPPPAYARAAEPGRPRPAPDDAAERHARPDDARSAWYGRWEGRARKEDEKRS